MAFGRAKFLMVAGAALLAMQGVASAADYPMQPPPPPQQYYPPQPVYQPPPPQPVYAPPPVYQPPPPQPIYQPAPQHVYTPPPVYMPPPVYVPPPPPQIIQPPTPVVYQGGGASDCCSSWYIRGDIGVSAQKYESFDFTQTNSNFVWPASWRIDQKDIKDTVYFGLGIGYQFSSSFRLDVTGEYRQSTKGKALGSYVEGCPGAPDRCFDLYDFDHQASVFMINAYYDFAPWWCFTPFVGIGIGAAYHTFDALTDIGLVAPQAAGFGYSSKASHDTTFAYAFHAGVAYDISKSFKIELAYRYLNMGSPKTGIINCSATDCAGSSGGPAAYYTLTNFTANELRLGIRWMFDCCEVSPPPPVVYQPPPPPPPLMRRG